MNNNKLSMEELVQTDGWKKFMIKLDIAGAILSGAVLIMFLAGLRDDKSFRLILTLALNTLAITSFFMAFHKFESDSKILSRLFYKIYGIGLSLGFVTLLYTMQKWPLPKEILAIVSVIMILVSLYLGFKEKTGENKNNIGWKYFLRLFVTLIPLLYIIVIMGYK